MNQRCIIQCWFGISDVSNNADLKSALYDTALIRNQRCIRQHWYHFSFEATSAVGYSADTESALYPTTLILNWRCNRQHWCEISAVSNSADSRIFTFKYEYLREFETEFENILGCESGADVGSVHEKNQR